MTITGKNFLNSFDKLNVQLTDDTKCNRTESSLKVLLSAHKWWYTLEELNPPVRLQVKWKILPSKVKCKPPTSCISSTEVPQHRGSRESRARKQEKAFTKSTQPISSRVETNLPSYFFFSSSSFYPSRSRKLTRRWLCASLSKIPLFFTLIKASFNKIR